MKILVAGNKINDSVLLHVADALHDQLLKYNIKLCRIPHAGSWIGLCLAIVKNCPDDCVVGTEIDYESANRFVNEVTGVKLVWIETEEKIRSPERNIFILHDHPMDVRYAVSRIIPELLK
jgi:hypothetical protein